MDCYSSPNTGSLYVYQFNPIEKTNRRQRYMSKLFKLKLKLAFAVCTHKLRITEVVVVTVEFQLQKFVDTRQSNRIYCSRIFF